MIRDQKLQWLIVASLVLLNVLARLLPHPPQFTPLAATALIAGAIFSDRRWALLVPLLSMLISDSLIGTYDWPVMLTVYGCLCVPLLLGKHLRQRTSVWRIGGAAVLSSLVFFVVTNFAVWACLSWYSHTADGLATCFVNALPFFRNTLFGDVCWSFGLFAAYQAIIASAPASRPARIAPVQ